MTKKTTIKTPAKATITLKKLQAQDVIGSRIDVTSQDDTEIQLEFTVTWVSSNKRSEYIILIFKE